MKVDSHLFIALFFGFLFSLWLTHCRIDELQHRVLVLEKVSISQYPDGVKVK